MATFSFRLPDVGEGTAELGEIGGVGGVEGLKREALCGEGLPGLGGGFVGGISARKILGEDFGEVTALCGHCG